jgi:hypothetical protein
MTVWTDPASLAALVGAFTGLVTAVTALVTALKSHSVAKSAKSAADDNTAAIQQIKNGH